MTDSDGAMVRRLLDIEEIKRLKAGYFRCLDRKEWDEFEHGFARDAVLEVPEANICETGRDAIVAAVSGVLTGTTTVHHGHMPEIEITGADTARGRCSMTSSGRRMQGTRRIGLQGYGHSIEEYVREDGAW